MHTYITKTTKLVKRKKILMLIVYVINGAGALIFQNKF